MSQFLHTVLAWVLSHPAEVTMAAGALASLAYSKLSAYPKLQAVAGALSHAGFNVPGVVKAVLNLLASKAGQAGSAAVLVLLLSSCHTLTTQDKTDLASYEAQQSACIAATPHDKVAVDACRAKVRAQWCADWKARFGQDVCAP
jgi:hypothetical protein